MDLSYCTTLGRKTLEMYQWGMNCKFEGPPKPGFGPNAPKSYHFIVTMQYEPFLSGSATFKYGK